MIADQMNRQESEQSAVWDQYFCAALIAESNLTAPVVGEATHEDRQNLLIQRAKALADKMLEKQKITGAQPLRWALHFLRFLSFFQVNAPWSRIVYSW